MSNYATVIKEVSGDDAGAFRIIVLDPITGGGDEDSDVTIMLI